MTEEQVKVLVVDDEEAVRKLLQKMLEQAGYRVTTAADGIEALYKVSLGEAEVILLDIKMPRMSGIEVLRKLSEEWPDYCMIMVTSLTDIETAVETLKTGAYDYITKPFDQNDVRQKVQNAITKWQKHKQEKTRYYKLSESVARQAEQMQAQFVELVRSLCREHRLLHELAARQQDRGKSMLSKLPKELQEPMSSVEEFRVALLNILKRSS